MCTLGCNQSGQCEGGQCNGIGDACCVESNVGSDNFVTPDDYPCNYEKSGTHSYTFYSDEYYNYPTFQRELTPGNDFTWTFNFSSESQYNYVCGGVCLFNFNQMYPTQDSEKDYVKLTAYLNDVEVKTFWLSNQGIDQANHSLYPSLNLMDYGSYDDDGPNTVKLKSDQNNDVNVRMVDPVGINIYRIYLTTNVGFDNFNRSGDFGTFQWDKLQANGGTAGVSNNKLQVTVPNGSGWAQAGYVTQNPFVMNSYANPGFQVRIDVAQLQYLDEMALFIGNNQVTSSDPHATPNWYRIVKGRNYWGETQKLAVESKIGYDWTQKVKTNWSASTGQLKIAVSSGSIAFYENGHLAYAEPFALPEPPSSDGCYVYAMASSNRAVSWGTDYFDWFELIGTQAFRDNFNDGNYDGWTVDNGNWAFSGTGNKRLYSTSSGSHIHVNTAFSANRHVKLNIQTLDPGANPWDVPWVFVKEQDGNNNVYALIKTDGIVELSMYYNSQKTTWTEQSSLDPTDPHELAVSIIGLNAKVWVDGTLYIDENNANLANLAGYVGLYTPSSTGSFDNIVVFDE
jgi:hypothetical protein